MSGWFHFLKMGLVGSVVLGLSPAAIAGAQAAEEPGRHTVETAVPDSVHDLKALETRVAQVIKTSTRATVSVKSGGGAGSGVVISEDGYVLTAGHVAISPGRAVMFTFPDGRVARGRSLGVNVGIDAGLMKITDKGPWPHVQMGDADSLRAGEWVVAMGHPGGFDKNRSVVSRLGRVYRVRPSVVQTDCTIIGGDSGGPLFDLEGKVVGIHSRISNGLRQNYHVPISIYEQSWDRLAAGEVWNRPLARGRALERGGPYIGVQGANGFAFGQGAALGRIYPDSPAQAAGLRVGDVIIEFDQSPVGSFGDLSALVRRLEPGDTASVIVKRGDERLEREIVIGKAE